MRIAAVGDSVMWGQGLMHPLKTSNFEDEQKYVFKVVEWLQNEGKVQDFDRADFLAHSGAKIGSKTDPLLAPKLTRDGANNKMEYDRYYGEIPDRNPTVLWQLKKLKNASSIDILLINGGPNDVEITESVSVVDPITDNFNEALKKIDRVAELRVSHLLTEARKTCPNAIIIYTGYYPGLSPDSDIPLSVSISNILTIGPSFGLFGGLILLADVYLRSQLPRIKRQGIEFHQRILAKFREQIAKFNEKRDALSGPILFCPSLFGSSNSMWANNEFVSSIGNDPNLKVSISRKNLCSQIHQLKLLDPFYSKPTTIAEKLGNLSVCSEAYIGHPNKKGAEQYFKELKKRIELQLNFSLRNHFKAIDSTTTSIRKLKDKYPIIPLKSLRGLSDFYWIEVIAVNCRITTPNPDFLIKSHYLVFLNTVMFDFGSGYRQLRGEGGRFVLELSGSSIKTLTHLKIRYLKIYPNILNIPPTATSSNISLEVSIQINGYQIRKIKLNRNSFKESGAYLLWETPKLNLEPDN